LTIAGEAQVLDHNGKSNTSKILAGTAHFENITNDTKIPSPFINILSKGVHLDQNQVSILMSAFDEFGISTINEKLGTFFEFVQNGAYLNENVPKESKKRKKVSRRSENNALIHYIIGTGVIVSTILVLWWSRK
jgi:hypothetical protein